MNWRPFNRYLIGPEWVEKAERYAAIREAILELYMPEALGLSAPPTIH